ncbi:MAG: pathogenicity-like protein [Lysobacteraceae bacterium]
MRRLFTSQRLETVEGVARLLNEAGIETWIEQRRAYKGNRRGQFSYNAPPGGSQPAVWIVRAEDQSRARALLREAGMIESSRDAHDPFRLPPMATQDPARQPRSRLNIRRVLLLAIAIIATVQAAQRMGWFG